MAEQFVNSWTADSRGYGFEGCFAACGGYYGPAAQSYFEFVAKNQEEVRSRLSPTLVEDLLVMSEQVVDRLLHCSAMDWSLR